MPAPVDVLACVDQHPTCTNAALDLRGLSSNSLRLMHVVSAHEAACMLARVLNCCPRRQPQPLTSARAGLPISAMPDRPALISPRARCLREGATVGSGTWVLGLLPVRGVDALHFTLRLDFFNVRIGLRMGVVPVDGGSASA